MAKKRKEAKIRPKKYRFASVLFYISIIILFGISILTVLLRKDISLSLPQYGMASSEIALVTYAVIWFVLGILAWITKYKIERLNHKNQKWVLFALSIIIIASGRLESGVIMLISSVIYLRKK